MRSNTHRIAWTDTDAPPERSRSARRRHRRRRMLLVGALLLVAGGGLLALSLVGSMGAVRDDLALGRASMERGRDELLAGDTQAAAASFREGRQLFAGADARSSGPAVRAIGWLPIVGRTSDAVRAVAGSAVTAADAAIVLTDAAAAVPGGLAGLAPTGGSIPIDLIPPLARAAGEADELMTDAVSRLEEAPDSLLLGPVGPARRDAEDELLEARDAIHAASLLLQGMPSFLGADEPRRYFFGAQNPAELRGTGGLIGAYSILRIDHGRFRFSPFVPIHSLGQPARVPPPNDDYADYEQFRRHGLFWTSINVMPDFPSVAQAILSSYEAATGEGLDGVFLADPFALAALLEATGPVELPGYGVEVDADNVVAFTTNEAYSLFTDPIRRKRVLGDVARAAFETFVGQSSADQADLQKLLEAASGRHIQVFSEDPAMQEGLRATPVGGALRPAGADDDLLSVVVNSGAGSKVDFYQEREVSYAVELEDDGSATADFELTLRNHAPTSGEPRYVIGPFRLKHEYFGPILRTIDAGESVALVNVYCGIDCVPREARLGGTDIGIRGGVDLEMRYLRHYYSIRSGEEETLRFSWDDADAWDGNNSGGVYRMTFTDQVTIRPATLTMRIEPPEGMQIVAVSSPMQVVDGAAVYQGEPGPRLDVAMEFRPSLPVRMWRNMMRFLTTPLFEL